jgi:hypothetical protein
MGVNYYGSCTTCGQPLTAGGFYEFCESCMDWFDWKEELDRQEPEVCKTIWGPVPIGDLSSEGKTNEF